MSVSCDKKEGLFYISLHSSYDTNLKYELFGCHYNPTLPLI